MILLCFKEIILGKILFQEDKVLYTSYPKGEQQLKQKYPVNMIYGLCDSQKRVLETMPNYLNEILAMANVKFYQDMLGITSKDSVKTKLEKLSTLEMAQDGFYIKRYEKNDL